MLKTIKTKIIAFTIPLIIFVFLFPTLFLAHQFKSNFEERSLDMFYATTQVILSGLEKTMIENEHPQLQETLEEIGKNSLVENLILFNQKGKILFSSIPKQKGENISQVYPEIDTTALETNETHKYMYSDKYISWQPIRNEVSCQHCHEEKSVISYLGMETKFTKSERFFYTGSRHIYILAVVFIFVLIAGYYLILNYFLGTPFKRFISALEEVEKGNLEVTLPAKTNDEIATLETHFNRMTDKIKTSLKQIEEMHSEQIRRADKMVTLGELAAEMAHEVNNPAGIIMSRTDYLLMESEDNDSLRNFHADLEVIMRQTENISAITKNILKYSKKTPVKFSNVIIRNVLLECYDLLKPRIQKRNIEFRLENDDDTCEIHGDSQQLNQVFINLLNNAIEAIREKGKISVAFAKKDHKIEIRIMDNGSGMDEETLSKIYLPFFTLKDPQKGTGLGLYVVKNILSRHNAQIECESHIGQGTTFFITFNCLDVS